MKTINLIVGIISVILYFNCTSKKEIKVVAKKKPNVLFIAIDDLRPELSCYGSEHIISPNIDKLATDGVLFTNAHTQQAVCAPSRNTLMTGLRPDKLGINNLSTFFRTKSPNVVTLSQYFAQNGYRSEGMGKIYHTGHGNQNDTLSWSNAHFDPRKISKKRKAIVSGDTTDLHTSYPRIEGKRIPYLKYVRTENLLDDELVAQHAINRLEKLKDSSFFLAVGFAKPHLPFVAPKKYWDLYDQNQITIPNKEKPNESPSYSFSNWGELRKYHEIPSKGYLNNDQTVNLIHGYYASVSYIDALVGELITKLKELDLYDNTIIVLWGDHGYKLGDYGDWCKHTNYEIDTRIPIIIKDVNENKNKGIKSDAIVETVDIYPTLCDLAGIEKPTNLQGSSFIKALNVPGFDWEDVAISQYPRKAKINNKKLKLMGYAMRTKKYRFIKWIDTKSQKTIDIELYDHTKQTFEIKNLAKDPNYKNLVNLLDQKFIREYNKEHR